MPRPQVLPKLTFKQQLAVFNLIRKGREILSKGELTATDAADLQIVADWAERECDIPPFKDEYERDLNVRREVLKS